MMFRVFLSLCFAVPLACVASFAQTSTCDFVYVQVEEMPEFGKSKEDLLSYLAKHLQLGECGLDEMKVLTWTIDAAGNMIDIDAPSLEGECKQKIIAQLKEFPRWKPGKQKGKPVCVKMTLRICIKTG